MILRSLCAFLLLAASSAVSQSEAGSSAEKAAQDLEQAAASLAAAIGSKDRIAALTETVRAYETGLIAMRDGLRQATIQRQALENRLASRREEIANLLGILQTLSQSAAPTLLLHPNGPTGMARSAMIATDVTPALEKEARGLRAELEDLAILQDLQSNAAETLEAGLQGAQTARSDLSEAISNRTDLPKRFEQDPVQTALLLASAETLTAFATGLTDAFSVENNVAYSTNIKGSLTLPLQGQIIRAFNTPDADGTVRPGIQIAARQHALVTSPTPATVLFVGPLLDYGNVAILEPAPDILFVMAGLAEIFTEAGHVIPEGFPIGLLGGENTSVDEILTESDDGNSGSATQTLYLEVREGQSPVNPATWFVLN